MTLLKLTYLDFDSCLIFYFNTDGDESRKWGPPFVGNESCMFLSVNRNKRVSIFNVFSLSYLKEE